VDNAKPGLNLGLSSVLKIEAWRLRQSLGVSSARREVSLLALNAATTAQVNPYE
jgi:hypothetical protein